MVQAVVADAGIDVTQFLTGKNQQTGQRRCRRSVKRLSSGIAVPAHTPLADLEKKKEDLYVSGKISRSLNIVPRQYEQTTFDGHEVRTKKKTIFGQKVPLHELIKITLTRLNERGLLAQTNYNTQQMTPQQIEQRLCLFLDNAKELTEEEQKANLDALQRTVRITNWGDHAALSGHGYLLYTITLMYDPAVFAPPRMSSSDIQRAVEQPSIYLLAMSSDTLADKLMYIDDRLTDIEQLRLPIVISGCQNSYFILLRSFKGDNPEQQYEAGINQGGHYKCSGCGAKTSSYTDMTACLQEKRLSIQARNDIALAGVLGKQASHAKPFHKLTKTKLEHELYSRGLDCTGLLKDMACRLQADLHGTQRVLTLMFRNPTDSLDDHNLGSYEIFSSEGLHDIKDHIKNVLEELPHHLTGPAKTLVTTFTERELDCHAIVRGSDYRNAVMKLTAAVRGKVEAKIQRLVDTLAELAILLYGTDEARTPRSILRLYNVSFMHANLCLEVLYPPRNLSLGVLYGLYFHKLMVHAAEETRIVSGYTRLTENEERQFKALREFAPCTNGHIEHVAKQLFERLQVRQETTRSLSSFTTENVHLEKKALKLHSFAKDTVLTEEFIQTNSSVVQAHLERIADYLLPGPGVWWVREGTTIRFLDGATQPSTHQEGPKLAHFRSTTVQNELEQVKVSWQQCIERHIELPLTQLRLQRQGERAQFVTWPPARDHTGIIKQVSQENGETHGIEEEKQAEYNEEEHLASKADTVDNTNEEEETEQENWESSMDNDSNQEEQQDVSDNQKMMVENNTPQCHNHEQENEPPRKRMCRRLPFTCQQRKTESIVEQDEDDCRVQPVMEDDSKELDDKEPATSLYKTLHGKWLARALGHSADVVEYDRLRYKIKRGQSSPSDCTQVKAIAGRLHMLLLCALRDTEKEMVSGKSTKSLEQKRRVVDKLLATWNC